MDDDEPCYAHLARRCAITLRPAEGRVRAWANAFDDVQSFARELEVAGDFEETPVRSVVEGAWCWRGFLREAVEAMEAPRPGRPAAYAPLGGYLRR